MSDWQAKAQKLIDERDAAIPKEWRLQPQVLKAAHPRVQSVFASCGILSKEELEITDMKNDATDLLAKLANGSLTSVAVTTAFLKRAAIAHQLTNCLVEIFPEEALETARARDAYFAKHKKPIGENWPRYQLENC
jgi:amidase